MKTLLASAEAQESEPPPTGLIAIYREKNPVEKKATRCK